MVEHVDVLGLVACAGQGFVHSEVVVHDHHGRLGGAASGGGEFGAAAAPTGELQR